jgi:hypothetical protein
LFPNSLEPLFISVERFGPWDGQSWDIYVQISGLKQLKELVSLDSMLCGSVLKTLGDEYWPHIVSDDHMLQFFVDLDFLLDQVAEISDKNILCAFRNPPRQPIAPTETLHFEFLGYDLVDVEGYSSALSNCGGFPKAFSSTEINAFGLLDTHERAVEVQASLLAFYPDDGHSDCHRWALFRAIGS